MTNCCHTQNRLEIVIPGVGEREAVCRCGECGQIFVMDSQPSAPANFPAFLPAGRIRVVDRSFMKHTSFSLLS